MDVDVNRKINFFWKINCLKNRLRCYSVCTYHNEKELKLSITGIYLPSPFLFLEEILCSTYQLNYVNNALPTARSNKY